MKRQTIATLLAAAALGSCDSHARGRAPAPTTAETDTALRGPVGWLGMEVAPVTTDLPIPDGDDVHHPGGLSILALRDDSLVRSAGGEVNDVIFRVGEDWLPLVVDPRLALMRLVEQSISSGTPTIVLHLWRKGATRTISIQTDREALEIGLPFAVARFQKGASAAAAKLPETLRKSHAANALTGLALLASHAKTEGNVAERLRAIDAAWQEVQEDAEGLSTTDLAWSLIYEAERLGPLPNAVRVAAATEQGGSAGKTTGKLPGNILANLPKGAKVKTIKAGSMAEVQDLIKKLGGKGKVTMVQGSGGAFPGRSGASMKPGRTATAKGSPKDLRKLLEKHDAKRVPELGRLRKLAKELLRRQRDDGGFAPPGSEESSSRLTSIVLTALGSLRRIGVEVAEKPLRRAVGSLRDSLEDGKLAAQVARGRDRRTVASDGALAAIALRAIGCPEGDAFLARLLTFDDKVGRHVTDAPRGRALGILATGLQRRARNRGTWQRFYDEFRIPLIAIQCADGSFAPFGGEADDPALGISTHAAATAIGTIVLALQDSRLPVLLGLAENPYASAIDGRRPERKVAPKPKKGNKKK